MRRAQVVMGGPWDVESVALQLGVTPLSVEPVSSPVLVVDGQIEPDATAWLAYVDEKTRGRFSTKTAESYANSLCQFACFLLDQNSSLRGAMRSHIVRYVNIRTVDLATRVAGATWSRDRTAIKQFYMWLRETHGVNLPFTLELIRTAHGNVESMREGRNIPKASASGTPMEPPQIRELMAAAWRLGPDGKSSENNVTGARDAAFLWLGLSCGARLDTLVHLTIYELPDPSLTADLVGMSLPGATSKSRREVRTVAFRRHLDHVYDYLNPVGGSRKALLKGWTPSDPLQVAQGPTGNFRGIIDTEGHAHLFNSMAAVDRRRLVTPEGEPAMLFLSARDGAPLSYASAGELTGDVSKIAEANASARGGFFPHVHTHDLRHTYATHLASLFVRGIGTGPELDIQGKPHRVDIRSAVQMAIVGLGHVDDGTVALYIQQVGLMALRYTVDDFLGRTK